MTKDIAQHDTFRLNRICPSCQNEIIYQTYSGYYCGKRKNSNCFACGAKVSGAKNQRPHYCKECKTEIPNKKNKSGYCGICYPIKMEREIKARKTYNCQRCGASIFSNNNDVIKRCIVRGYCYNCLKDERHNIEVDDASYWHRECPTCKKKISYQTYSGYYSGNRKNGDCLDCCKLKLGGKIKSTTPEFIQKSIGVHGSIYDYSKVDYKGVLKKVIIVCKKHGDFLQSPQEHLNGHGCSVCYASHGERQVRRFLEKNSIEYHAQKTFVDCINPKTGRNLYYDFYVPHKNLLIEFDGSQHHRETPCGQLGRHKMTIHDWENIKYRDNIKNLYAENKNIDLLRITYKQIDDVDIILRKEIYG